MTQTTRRTFTQSIHHAFIFPTPAGSRTFAFGSLLATVTGLFPACDPATAPSADGPRIDSIEQGVIAYGQADWVQLRGRRDTSQVQYYKEFWRDTSGCNSRFGCRSMTVFIKLRVKPAASADLSKKKIGVVYREAGRTDPVTVVGNYFTTHGDGYEEWHVPVKSDTFRGTFLFTAWYEDGAGGTFFDDNSGQRYAIQWQSSDWQTLAFDYANTTARFDSTGVHGVLSFVVQDLDYDKVLKLVYSTDGWATSQEIPMGAAGSKNTLYWKTDIDQDFERWHVDVDLPGSFSTFSYKLVYRHGTGGGASPAEFSYSSGLAKM
jgi:hypothetical protein